MADATKTSPKKVTPQAPVAATKKATPKKVPARQTSKLDDHLKKEEVLRLMADMSNVTKEQAKKCYDSIVQLIRDELDDSRSFRLTGVGVFYTTEQEGRKVTNPRDPSKTMDFEAYTRICFKPSTEFKDDLNRRV